MPAIADQQEFDFLVIYSKPLLRVDEVGAVLRLGKDAIYALCDEGKLEWHQGDADRSHRRITRRSVVARLASTARYHTQDHIDLLYSLARRLPVADRQALAKRILQ